MILRYVHVGDRLTIVDGRTFMRGIATIAVTESQHVAMSPISISEFSLLYSARLDHITVRSISQLVLLISRQATHFLSSFRASPHPTILKSPQNPTINPFVAYSR